MQPRAVSIGGNAQSYTEIALKKVNVWNFLSRLYSKWFLYIIRRSLYIARGQEEHDDNRLEHDFAIFHVQKMKKSDSHVTFRINSVVTAFLMSLHSCSPVQLVINSKPSMFNLE